jgi:hypothetical protein
MKQISKFALIGALLAATVSAASAQAITDPHDQRQINHAAPFQNAPLNEPDKNNVGENAGGGA